MLPEDLIAALRVVAAADGLIAPTITKHPIEQCLVSPGDNAQGDS